MEEEERKSDICSILWVKYSTYERKRKKEWHQYNSVTAQIYVHIYRDMIYILYMCQLYGKSASSFVLWNCAKKKIYSVYLQPSQYVQNNEKSTLHMEEKERKSDIGTK